MSSANEPKTNTEQTNELEQPLLDTNNSVPLISVSSASTKPDLSQNENDNDYTEMNLNETASSNLAKSLPINENETLLCNFESKLRNHSKINIIHSTKDLNKLGLPKQHNEKSKKFSVNENKIYYNNLFKTDSIAYFNSISLDNLKRPSGIKRPGDDSKKRIVINVGGVRFETYKTTLSLIDDTRLACLNETNSDYDPIRNEFFFDRDPNSFLAILNYLRTGKLHAPQDVCGNLFYEELDFWGITERSIQPCCWTNYSSKRECDDLLKKLMDEFKEEPTDMDNDNLNESADERAQNVIANSLESGGARIRRSSKKHWLINLIRKNYHRYRPHVWRFLDEKNSSLGAAIFFWISIVFLVMSILNFVLETSPIFRVPYEIATNKSLKRYERDALTVPHAILINIEFICNIFFTIEYVLRFLSSPDKLKFIKNPYNILEFLAIFPFFWPVEKLNADGVKIVTFGVKVHNFTEVFYVLRILKIFTIVPKHSGLRVLLLTLKNSIGELGLYLVMLIMTIMIFASFVYYAEQIFEEDDNKFDSILIGLWWAIVTMTTLGYGDIVPVTPFGYIIGGMCAISGLIFMSLPIPVIVNNFTSFYAQAKARQKLKEYTEAQKTLNYKAAFSTALQIQPSDVMKSSISGPHKGDSFVNGLEVRSMQEANIDGCRNKSMVDLQITPGDQQRLAMINLLNAAQSNGNIKKKRFKRSKDATKC